jgi:hypothetical protein
MICKTISIIFPAFLIFRYKVKFKNLVPKTIEGGEKLLGTVVKYDMSSWTKKVTAVKKLAEADVLENDSYIGGNAGEEVHLSDGSVLYNPVDAEQALIAHQMFATGRAWDCPASDGSDSGGGGQ